MRRLFRAIIAVTAFTACLAQDAAPPVPASTPATAAAPKPVDYYALAAADFFKLPQVQQRIRKDSFDVVLLEAAIFQQTNLQRVSNKLPVFRQGWAMNLMARRHSREMADLQYFDHVSPTPANRTLTERLKSVGLANVAAGENIAVLPAKEMGSGEYIVRDAPDGGQILTDAATGKLIDYCTYQELAEAVLKQWMDSPPHHAGIVNKAFIYLGVGVARGPYEAMHQDSFYMTQNFSGSVTVPSEDKARSELIPATKPKADGN